jgi:hypothetical protein
MKLVVSFIDEVDSIPLIRYVPMEADSIEEAETRFKKFPNCHFCEIATLDQWFEARKQ